MNGLMNFISHNELNDMDAEILNQGFKELQKLTNFTFNFV